MYGRIGDEALNFIERIASFASENQATYSPGAIREGILNEISVALQTWNAAMLQRALNREMARKSAAAQDQAFPMDLSSAAEMQ